MLPEAAHPYDDLRRERTLVTIHVKSALAIAESRGLAIDKGFEYALLTGRYEMLCPKPWRKMQVDMMDMRRRQEEWNVLIEEYIKHASQRGDLRTKESIQKACLIDKYGGPLYKACCNSACARLEETPYSWLACGGCGFVWYCSRECQRAVYKREHKAVCGKIECHALLPSQAAFEPCYEEVIQKVGEEARKIVVMQSLPSTLCSPCVD